MAIDDVEPLRAPTMTTESTIDPVTGTRGITMLADTMLLQTDTKSRLRLGVAAGEIEGAVVAQL